ncbi:tRNA lysidine(34) synthetase TilS [Legionella lytica]|uniref:tRNA(Ile)-lysidine synthase n=1 Tax=Legionella lytica TaxID=96232 RepID=A0ABY4YBJ4_9GAMM|nr:tRNA lysidine(34) synthetase TilS [Legionella lytica]USQ14896.1 tRNA lysidine(34) synthetase TilS [Legionella lytica]
MNRPLTQLLNADWLVRLEQFDKLVIGFSGGLDSTVLLHALATHSFLHAKLLAVHINHGISPNAISWQQHCEQFCRYLGINFVTEAVQFDRSANIEEGARVARYAVFSALLTEKDCLVLGHHQDDQAETVLLQLLRGAGVDGLAAMTELGTLGRGAIARPCLNTSRAQLEQYARSQQLSWIDDESNQDISYSRNYLRQQILPVLAEKWPGAVGTIARTALHCQQAKSNLDALALQDCPELSVASNSLCITPLIQLDFARIANVLRTWLKKRQIQAPSTVLLHRMIDELIFARIDAVPQVTWDEVVVRRYQQHLYLDKKNTRILPNYSEWVGFPSPLMLGVGGLCVSAEPAKQGLVVPPKAKIAIRFRQGGETFFLHGQTKQLKKLFQEWQIPPWQRGRIPLLYINDELAAIVNYAISDVFFNHNASLAWSLKIQQTEDDHYD